MANFALYGANPSELAAQQRFYDEFYTRTAESNRSAAFAAQQASQAAAERARQEDERAMDRDYSHGVNRLQLYLSDQERQRNDRLRMAELGLRMRQYAPGEQEYKDLSNFAGVLTPDQITKYGPNIGEPRRAGLIAFAESERKRLADAETERKQRNINNAATRINWAAFTDQAEAEKAGVVTPETAKYVPAWIATARDRQAQEQADQLNGMLGKAVEHRIAEMQTARRRQNPLVEPPAPTDEDYALAMKFHPTAIESIKAQLPMVDPRVRFDTGANRFVTTPVQVDVAGFDAPRAEDRIPASAFEGVKAAWANIEPDTAQPPTAPAAQPVAAPVQRGAAPEISTQAEFDALPPGTTYVNTKTRKVAVK